MLFRNESHEGLLFGEFNQNTEWLSVGTASGYGIYDLNTFERRFHERTGGRLQVTPAYTSSLAALVGTGEHNGSTSMRTLLLYNMGSDTVISELHFPTPVLNVKINHDRLVVVLEQKIDIFDLRTLKKMISLETESNSEGLCALTTTAGQTYLAFPKNDEEGIVVIYDATNLMLLQELHAHKAKLTALVFDSTSTMLATASETGTIIRVFRIPDGEEIYLFRRGTIGAVITCLAFSCETDDNGSPAPAKFLACSSNTSTIHVFKLEGPMGETEDKGFVSAYLPSVLSEVWDPQRKFAFAKLEASLRSVCALKYRGTKLRLLLLTEGGTFLEYDVDAAHGGECKGPVRSVDVLRDTADGDHHGGVELAHHL